MPNYYSESCPSEQGGEGQGRAQLERPFAASLLIFQKEELSLRLKDQPRAHRGQKLPLKEPSQASWPQQGALLWPLGGS